MGVGPREAWADLVDIDPEMPGNRLRESDGVRAPRFGVVCFEEDRHAIVVERDVPTEGQGREASPADRVQAEERDDQAVL